jgi:hypothetical protein
MDMAARGPCPPLFKEASIKAGASVSDPVFQICRRQRLNFIALIVVYS